jgi:hypothetical protein
VGTQTNLLAAEADGASDAAEVGANIAAQQQQQGARALQHRE